MKFYSTRGEAAPISLSDAIQTGQAGDGGLLMPEHLPADAVSGAVHFDRLADFAAAFLSPFFHGDRLEPALPAICAEAFDITLPEIALADGMSALELFHGPTGAFKDFGARFLMACLDRLGDADAPFTVLAATSGDTGGAAGCAAEGRSGVRAVILYPEGRVSPFQAHQLACWGAPVATLKLDVDFDTCQHLVKAAFRDPALSRRHRLTSANSINIARLLPQAAYLAFAAVRHHARSGAAPGLILPAGNLGHGVAALMAKACGAPLADIILATNANRTLHDWAQSGRYEPRASIPTIANAMDVGAPSNFERLQTGALNPADLQVERVEDETIRSRIDADYLEFGYIWCPHSACAAEAYARLPKEKRQDYPWMIAATAHPYKFADIVEPVLQVQLTPPPALSAVLDRPARAHLCPAELSALSDQLRRLESLPA